MKSIIALCVLGACVPIAEPEGGHFFYVVSSLGDSQFKQNDSRFGTRLSDGVSDALRRGASILLLDLQAANPGGVAPIDGLVFHIGRSPSIAPCASADDNQCGLHLTGAASFVAGDDNPVMTGTGVGRVDFGTTGRTDFEVAFAPQQILRGDAAVSVALIEFNEDAIASGRILFEGVADPEQIRGTLMATAFNDLIDQECGPLSDRIGKPDCNCGSSVGAMDLLNAFDTDPRNCGISAREASAFSPGTFTLEFQATRTAEIVVF